MTSVTEISRRRAASALGTFERYLTLWVALCIIAGIVLGRLVPGPFQALGRMTVAEVNIPVALNYTIMVFAFAPIVGLLLGLSSITVPWETLFLSVVLYIVVPVIAAQIWRRSLLAQGGDVALAETLRKLQPVSLLALWATLVLLF